MVTRILTLVRGRTTPAATAGQCSTQNQPFNDDEKLIQPVAAAASSVEAKKEYESSALFTRENQLREAEATTVAVAIARPSKSVDNDPQHAASQRKRQCSGSEGEDVVPKKIARKRPKKLCSADGCKNQSQREGVCFRHGAKRKLCSSEGCTSLAQSGKVCFRHGARRKVCSSDGCKNQSQRGGVCRRHGAKPLCSAVGCTNQSRRGGVCRRHGAKPRLCSAVGCTNQSLRGGVCTRHGANINAKRCSAEGCTSLARNGGVCISIKH